jgi:hypothetical protein
MLQHFLLHLNSANKDVIHQLIKEHKLISQKAHRCATTHTNCVESEWNSAKLKFKRMHGVLRRC